MISRLRFWLIRLLAGKDSVLFNVYLFHHERHLELVSKHQDRCLFTKNFSVHFSDEEMVSPQDEISLTKKHVFKQYH